MSDRQRPTLDDLATAVGGDAVVLCEANSPPRLREVGTVTVARSILDRASDIATTLPYNEVQAVHDGDSDSLRRSMRTDRVITYRRLRFSTIMALRTHGELPRFIASSAIPVDYTRRELVLHRRGTSVKTYPNTIGTVGGAFAPEEDADLFNSLQRECFEEASIKLDRDPVSAGATYPPSILVGDERFTGSVQIVYLHRSFRREGQWSPSPGDFDEGTPIFLGFDELPELLTSPEWVPSARLHVLVWLRQLAFHPGCLKLTARFAGLSAAELLLDCLKRPWKPTDKSVIITD